MSGPAPRDGLKVGVTLFIRDGHQSIWENGIFQNCYFLLMLLARSPAVAQTFIVNGGPGDPSDARDFLALSPAPVIGLGDAQELDVVIELSAQLDPEWGRTFKARGGRIVGMRVANDYVIDLERMIYGLSPGTLFSGTPYDAIWTLPAFRDTCIEYYRVGTSAPVVAMQHLWSPCLIERSIAELPVAEFGYQPGRSRWRLAVLEPNICSVKTCHLPILVIEEAHRRSGHLIDFVRIYSTSEIRTREFFITFAKSLDIVQQGLASFEDRFPIYHVMKDTDAIVSHHWHNGQNYLYYEALWGGYPLVHNSPYLNGCGYSYRDFDNEDGAMALLEAKASHDHELRSYRHRASAFLATLDPLNEANIAAYTRALTELGT